MTGALIVRELRRSLAGAAWLPVAFFAERSGFRAPGPRVNPTSVKAADIEARKARDGGLLMMKPYLNVVRLHLLIFLFAFAHFMRWENIAVYGVVYAVYFFPWRLLVPGRRTAASVTQ